MAANTFLRTDRSTFKALCLVGVAAAALTIPVLGTSEASAESLRDALAAATILQDFLGGYNPTLIQPGMWMLECIQIQ